MPEPLLHIKNLTIDFVDEGRTISALRNVSLQVNRGEVVAIVGESGSGKSVTALSLLGLLPSTAVCRSGELRFAPNAEDPVDLLRLPEKNMRTIRGNQIAMIFQEPMSSLNPVFTCGSQVMEAIRLHKKVSAGDARQQTLALFRQVKLPDPESMLLRYPHQLSGGQKQRVMIAMAMSCKPALLVCDEPTTALDVSVQQTILRLIRELQHTTDMGVIFITHDLGVVAEVADRAIVLYKGSIVETGAVKQLFSFPRNAYTRGLLECRPALHKKGERLPVVSEVMDAGSLNRPELPFKHQPDRVAQVSPRQSIIPGISNAAFPTLFRIENLAVWYPAKKNFLGKPTRFLKALDGVSFDIHQGETLGIVGESGCGKTTLGMALLRLVTPDAGQIFYNGTDLSKLKPGPLKALRKDIQLIFQDPYASLNPRITVGSAIGEALSVHRLAHGSAARRQAVTALLEKVNLLPDHAYRYPHAFSGGQRQRIAIARALALQPSFIVCDESVSALDVSVQAQVLNLLNDLKKEFGFTIVFISHDLSVIRYMSDRILVMNEGKIEEMGDAEMICSNPQKAYTRRLLAAIPGSHLP